MIKKIGFVGQGWIGNNYAGWYEKYTKYEIVRYSLEPEYIDNKDKIKDCDLVYICVPTPTTPEGFDSSILEKVIPLVGIGKTILLKSTLLPGTAKKLQGMFPDRVILFSPEFLTEATAAYDVANPARNIIGYSSDEGFKQAGRVMTVLPIAPYEQIMKSEEAELVKYGGNCWFYYKVVFMNLFYDWVKAHKDVDFEVVKEALSADKRIGRTHLDPVHKKGRGAGGDCFIKDFEAFRTSHADMVGDETANDLMRLTVKKNLELLKETGKDQALVKGVYGDKDV